MSYIGCPVFFPVKNCYIGLGVIEKCSFKELSRKFFMFSNGHVERTMSGFNYAAIGWSPHSCIIFFQLENEKDENEILCYLGLSEVNIIQIYDPDVSILEMSVDVTLMEEHYVAGVNKSYNVIVLS